MSPTKTKQYLLLFFYLKDVKIDHFKPTSSSDVTKIKDTFYIEWQTKFNSNVMAYDLTFREKKKLRDHQS